jgi:hypothetical protein
VHYRGNWYLDAWCHLRGDLRGFALDGIGFVHMLDEPAREVADEALDAFLVRVSACCPASGCTGRGYASAPSAPAGRVRTLALATARQFDASGRYLLEVPYSDPRELLGGDAGPRRQRRTAQPAGPAADAAGGTAAALALNRDETARRRSMTAAMRRRDGQVEPHVSAATAAESLAGRAGRGRAPPGHGRRAA